MTIAKRLILLLAVPLVALFGLGVFTRLQLSDVEERSRFVAEDQIPSLATLGNISRSFSELRVNARSHLLATNDAQRAAARSMFDEDEKDLAKLLQGYGDKLITGERDRRLYHDYLNSTREWIAGAKQVMLDIEAGRREEAAAHWNSRVTEIGARLSKISSEWISHNEKLATDDGRAAMAVIDAFRWKMLLANSAALLVTAVLGYLTFRRIVRPIQALESSVKTIAAGDYSKTVPFTEDTDETGGLARSIDVLKQGAAAMDEQRWVKSSAAKLTGELQGAASLAEFGQRLVSGLVPLLGGGVAGFYLVDEKTGRLQRIAAYGLAEDASSADAFRLGEGLVGQCAQERKVVTLANLPPDYLRIASGLGAAAPKTAVASPLATNDALLGVLELASFREFNSREKALLDELLPVVALSLEVLQRNLRTQELLAQTQEQARQLEEQTEELTQSQEELLAQKEELIAQQAELQTQHSALESAANAIAITDRKGTIQWVNAAFTRLTGYERAEAIGQNPRVLKSGAHEPEFYGNMWRTVGGGSVWHGTLTNKRKDGVLYEEEMTITPVCTKQGEITHFVAVKQDITLRKQQEAEVLAAKEKAEEATQMKSMFLANMSHEIRTPMNAIIGLSHLALKTQLTPKQRDYISKVHNAGTSLLAIINDILDFSKIEAGKLDIETTDFQLDEVIGSVTTVTAQKAHDKGLEFLADVSSAIPEQLRGDPLRLGQILTNLVNNAIKFTERGEIRLKIELLEKTGEKAQLKFSVRDTGIGMTREQAAKLFQPFSQADMSTTRKHGGTGLGLTICRRLVELMGGQIWLESEAGVGSTFIFTIWLGVGEITDTGKRVPSKFENLHVLVVDDNAAAREILVESLEPLAERADAVSSGHEALAAIKERDADSPYDVIFMDWRMPGMDGLQATRLIKNDSTLRKQPAVIIVTAFGREEVREEAEKLHVDGFLVKPVTKSMLVDSLVNVFATTAGEATAAAVGSAEESVRLNGLRVLLTEDNEINQQIAVELLEGVGAKVDVASNGRIAVEKLSAAPDEYDVVLMDLQMPEMDGYQATAKIRSEARFAKLPIIAMTAHATMEERQRCLDAGMNDHVSKPIDPGLLFETVGRYYKPAPAVASVAQTSKSAVSQVSQPATLRPVERGADLEIGDTAGLETCATSAKPRASDVPSIAGLDAKDGLTRVAGNQKLYLKLLRQFVEQQGPAVGQITTALAQGDIPLAERLAHTLKGVAGNIGAKLVQSAAGILEKLIRDRADSGALESAKQQVAAALDPLLSQLQATPSASAPQAPPQTAAPITTNPAQSREAAAQLNKLLSEFDPSATDFTDANQAALRPLFAGEVWAKFEHSIQNYSFAEAQAQLEESLKQLPPA